MLNYVVASMLLLCTLLSTHAAHAVNKGDVLWEFKTDAQVWSPLASRGDLVYFGSDDGNFHALNTRQKKETWRYHSGAAVRSGAAFYQDMVLFASDDGYLYALNSGNGKLIWKFDLGSAGIARNLPSNLGQPDYDYLASSPVVDGDTVYVGSADGNLYSIDVQSGRLRWKFATAGRIRATPVLADGQVCVGSWDHFFYCLERDSGKQQWRYDTKKVIQSSAVVSDGKIVFGGRKPALFALDAKSGKEIWIARYADGSWVESSAVADAGMLYVGSSDSLKLSAFESATGKEIWKFNTGGWSWMTPLLADGVLYIGAISASPYYFPDVTLRSGFYAVDATSGKQLWQYQPSSLSGSFITGGVFARPVLTADAVLVADLDGTLRALAR
ncbi:MAG: PQQ-binding-like beta-propeller repeat protein [Pseudomonadota bacterium]